MPARHKNRQYTLPDHPSLDYATFGILMDIRDELQDLNRLLNCRNFIGIPKTLNDIKSQIARRKRKTTL